MLLYLIFYLLFGINVILSLSKKKSLFISLLTFLLLGLLFMLNTGTDGDHLDYKEMFLYPDKMMSKDLFFYYFVQLSRLLGISNYNVFLLFEFLLGTFLIIAGTKEITTNYHPMLAVSMLYIYPHCAVAIRFFMAFCFAVFSIRFFIKRESLKYKILYIACLIVASLFHIATVVLFITVPLLFIPKSLNLSRLWRYAAYAFFGISIALMLFLYVYKDSSFFSLALITFADTNDMGSRGLASYIEEIQSRNGMLLCVPAYFSSLLLSYKMYKEARICYKKEDVGSLKLFNIFSSIFFINVACVFVLVLIFVDMTFLRLLFIPAFLTLIGYGKFLDINLTKSRYARASWLFIICLLSWEIPNYFELFSISVNGWIKEALLFF